MCLGWFLKLGEQGRLALNRRSYMCKHVFHPFLDLGFCLLGNTFSLHLSVFQGLCCKGAKDHAAVPCGRLNNQHPGWLQRVTGLALHMHQRDSLLPLLLSGAQVSSLITANIALYCGTINICTPLMSQLQHRRASGSRLHLSSH